MDSKLVIAVAGVLFLFAAITTLHTIFSQTRFTQNETNEEELASFVNLREIPSDTFLMGFSKTPLPYLLTDGKLHKINGDSDEQPYHNVTISKKIFMSATEITNAQYRQFNPNHVSDPYGFSVGDNDAVVMVSWYDAVDYCKWLSSKHGKYYRLPTEAEWEYAARAGTQTCFNVGDYYPKALRKFQENSWFPGRRTDGDSVHLTTALFEPNDFGLYDMHGNVEEWVSDWYHPYSAENQTDPMGPPTGEFKVTRGGSHSTELYFLRTANRMAAHPDEKSWLIGFRVVLDLTEELSENKHMHTRSDDRVAKKEHRANPKSNEELQGPFLEVRQFVQIAPNNTNSLPFMYHNHDPAVMPLPNGDVFAIWYSCFAEDERQLGIVSSRLRAGESEWEPAQVFWDIADRNDHAPALFYDYSTDTLYHFNSLAAAGTWGSTAVVMRHSTDYGYTWSAARFILPEHKLEQMVVESIIELSSGEWVMPCDNTTYSSGGTVIYISSDKGQTWKKSKGAIAGIHASVVQLDDGGLLAFGRGASVDGFLAKSVSYDLGNTWNVSASTFPEVGWGQRIVVKKLSQGPLLFVGFAKSLLIQNSQTLQQWNISGMFCALSFDQGNTWTHHKPLSHTAPSFTQTTDGEPALDSWKSSQPVGYLSARQHTDGTIHVVSSRNHYHFSYEWLTEPPTIPDAQLTIISVQNSTVQATTLNETDTEILSFKLPFDPNNFFYNYVTQELVAWGSCQYDNNMPFSVLDGSYQQKRNFTLPCTHNETQVTANIGANGTVIYVVSTISASELNVCAWNDDSTPIASWVIATESKLTPLAAVSSGQFVKKHELWIHAFSFSTYYMLNFTDGMASNETTSYWDGMFFDWTTNDLLLLQTNANSTSLIGHTEGELQYEFPSIVGNCFGFDEVSTTWWIGCDIHYQYDTRQKQSLQTQNASSNFLYFSYH